MTIQSLQNELNDIRAKQLPLTSFKTVSEWIAYGQKIAVKKAEILGNMEKLAR